MPPLQSVTHQTRAAVVALAAALLPLPVLAGCSHTWTAKDAGRCAGIYFPNSAKTVYIKGAEGFQDSSLKLVVDLPSIDVNEFRKLSNLPDFEPGIPDSWHDLWDETHFEKAVAEAAASDVGHIYVSEDFFDERKIAAVGLTKPETRLYLRMWCRGNAAAH